MPIFNIFLFVNKGHENTKTDDALVCLLSVTICLRAMCLSSVFLVSPCPPVSCVCVCVLSVLFMWHGCGYLLPAPGLPWHMAHVLIVTSSKCCGISTLSGVVIYSGCYIHWPSSSFCSLFLLVLSLFYRGLFHKT